MCTEWMEDEEEAIERREGVIARGAPTCEAEAEAETEKVEEVAELEEEGGAEVEKAEERAAMGVIGRRGVLLGPFPPGEKGEWTTGPSPGVGGGG